MRLAVTALTALPAVQCDAGSQLWLAMLLAGLLLRLAALLVQLAMLLAGLLVRMAALLKEWQDGLMDGAVLVQFGRPGRPPGLTRPPEPPTLTLPLISDPSPWRSLLLPWVAADVGSTGCVLPEGQLATRGPPPPASGSLSVLLHCSTG